MQHYATDTPKRVVRCNNSDDVSTFQSGKSVHEVFPLCACVYGSRRRFCFGSVKFLTCDQDENLVSMEYGIDLSLL